MMVPFVAILLLYVTKLSWCRPDGAPSTSCQSMAPGHLSSGPRFRTPLRGLLSNSPYKLRADWDNKRKYIRVSVRGETLQGFLIQGRTSENGPAVGQFVKLSDSSNFKYQDCSTVKFGANSSVTHANAADKEDLIFYWEPPANLQEGEVTFRATLALTRETFWVGLNTNSVSLEKTSKNETIKNESTSPNATAISTKTSVSHSTITGMSIHITKSTHTKATPVVADVSTSISSTALVDVATPIQGTAIPNRTILVDVVTSMPGTAKPKGTILVDVVTSMTSMPGIAKPNGTILVDVVTSMPGTAKPNGTILVDVATTISAPIKPNDNDNDNGNGKGGAYAFSVNLLLFVPVSVVLVAFQPAL